MKSGSQTIINYTIKRKPVGSVHYDTLHVYTSIHTHTHTPTNQHTHATHSIVDDLQRLRLDVEPLVGALVHGVGLEQEAEQGGTWCHGSLPG